MQLNKIAEAVRSLDQAGRAAQKTSLLVYGDPKTGKTRLLATIAKIPEIKRMFWFDTENGKDTLVKMAIDGLLTEEEAGKITVFQIVDTPDQPVAMDTVLKCLVEPRERKICEAHGRVVTGPTVQKPAGSPCPVCSKNPDAKYQTFDLTKLTHEDWVIVDSGSQFGTSCLNYATKGMDYDERAGLDEYGMVTRMTTDLLTMIQSGAYCNWGVITHQIVFEKKIVSKKDGPTRMISDERQASELAKIYPLFGSRTTSMGVGKYFHTVMYLEKLGARHKGGSGSSYKPDVITGSRIGMRLEDESELDMRLVYSKLGLTAWKPPVAPAKK